MRLTPEQRAERRKSIGGSDAAAAVNLSPWTSPYRLWLEKIGESTDDREDENADAKHFGNVLEVIVANEFQRRTGIKVQRVTRKLSHPDPKFSFMSASIDRRLIGVREGLECKTASPFVADQWGYSDDQMPVQYLIQCMHYLAVTGWSAWNLAVLIGGNDFRTFRIERDEEMIADLCQREAEFWDRVVTRTPPDLVSLDDAFLRWPKDFGKPIVASPNARRAYDRLIKLRAEADDLEARMEKEVLEIKKWMGDHSTLLDVDGATQLATWKAQSTKRIDHDKLRENYPTAASDCTYISESRPFRLPRKK